MFLLCTLEIKNLEKASYQSNYVYAFGLTELRSLFDGFASKF